MTISIFTDIPVWVRPLARALEAAGANVVVAKEPSEVAGTGMIVNRVSSGLMGGKPQRAMAFQDAIAEWEQVGRTIINGSDCYRIGHSKLAQARLFEQSGVKTPQTRAAIPGGRALPGIPVLLKPTAGGFGKGIIELDPREDAPDSLFTSTDGWVEQEFITAADGIVHRIEILGDRILYEARSPLTPGEYNYCLAHAESSVTLSLAKDLPVTITKSTLRIASTAGMELGAVEYLLDGDGEPVFIDLNPVSSLHPRASDLLGEDPIVMTADYLIRRTREPASVCEKSAMESSRI